MANGVFELIPHRMEDAGFAADLYTEENPHDPADAEIVADRWSRQGRTFAFERFIVLDGRRRVGLLYHGHVKPWPPSGRRFGRVTANLTPAVRTTENLAWLLDEGGRLEAAAGAEVLAAGARETDAVLDAALRSLGFREDRRQRHWELDLPSNAAAISRMAGAARRRMRDQGFELKTLAEDGDPDVRRKLHRVVGDAEADIPSTVPIGSQDFETFSGWLQAPGILSDRFWIARHGEQVVGLSVLRYPPSRGHVVTDLTGVARSARGRGVARALKLETLMQALALGISRVRTDNDSANAPILHLNEDMGYREIPGRVEYLKDA